MSVGLSIVIPTHGRSDLVVALLQSIADDAKKTPFPVEVILVDDTPPPQKELIARTAKNYNAKIVTGVRHVGEKRNRGLVEAQYDFVLFLDSDVSIKPGTLNAHYRALNDAPDDVAACLGNDIGGLYMPWLRAVCVQMDVVCATTHPEVKFLETLLHEELHAVTFLQLGDDPARVERLVQELLISGCSMRRTIRPPR